jgi:hypothetical protein
MRLPYMWPIYIYLYICLKSRNMCNMYVMAS